MEPISERVEAYSDQGPVFVEEVTPPALIELESGVVVEERFFGRPGQSANFRVTAAMEVVNADLVEPAYQIGLDDVPTVTTIPPALVDVKTRANDDLIERTVTAPVHDCHYGGPDGPEESHEIAHADPFT